MTTLKCLPSVCLLASAGLAHAQSFSETFDDVTQLHGWATVNHSENPDPAIPGWFQGVAGNRITSHEGAASAYVACDYEASQGLLGTETLSAWLFLPVRTLQNGDQLTFFTRCIVPNAVIYPDRMQVRMSSSGESIEVGNEPLDVGVFTTLLLELNPNYSTNQFPDPPTGSPPTVDGYPVTYTQYTVTLSGLPAGGVSGRFAFRYFVENGGYNGIHSNYIGVDTLEYIAVPATSCYANCDNSTAPPILNAIDFQCFLNKFAAAENYANCDGSTAAPVLNAIDFQCFLNRFAIGCT